MRTKKNDIEIDYENVALRAYHIWNDSGRPDGKHQEHWLQAEAEIRKQLTTEAPKTKASAKKKAPAKKTAAKKKAPATKTAPTKKESKPAPKAKAPAKKKTAPKKAAAKAKEPAKKAAGKKKKK